MNRLEFAESLIRAPWLRRLADRSFLLAVGAACLGVYLQQHGAISGSELVNLLSWTVGPWIVAEKGKDALLGNAALKMPEAHVAAPLAFVDADGDGLPDSEGDGPQDDEAPAEVEEVPANG